MNTTRKILLATVFLGGAAAVALPVMAQDATPAPKPEVTQVRLGDGHRGPGPRGGFGGPGRLIQQFDANADGTVSTVEVNAKLGEYDQNNDGSLSLEEYQALFAAVTNQAMVRTFQFLDRDGDAIVTETELSQPLEHMQARMADHDDDDDHRRGPRAGGRHGGDDDHGPRGGGRGWQLWR